MNEIESYKPKFTIMTRFVRGEKIKNFRFTWVVDV